MTERFTANDGIFQQSVFTVLRDRGACNAPCELVSKWQHRIKGFVFSRSKIGWQFHRGAERKWRKRLVCQRVEVKVKVNKWDARSQKVHPWGGFGADFWRRSLCSLDEEDYDETGSEIEGDDEDEENGDDDFSQYDSEDELHSSLKKHC